ncbi:MAG: DUF4330 domain-containing protein [Ruminococcaceae bacterium]|nr:DUF4330 domain-containing protein [Oscillospiraceae bacterium]
MLDKRGKLFGKISIVDIFIVCIIVVMAIGAYAGIHKLSQGNILTEDKALIKNSAVDTLDVTLLFEEVRPFTAEALYPGDEVFMDDTGKYLGDVVSVSTRQAQRLIYDSKGNAINAKVPERVDVFVSVRVPGKKLANGFYTANNIQLVHDAELKIKTTKVESIPTIYSIKTVSE